MVIGRPELDLQRRQPFEVVPIASSSVMPKPPCSCTACCPKRSSPPARHRCRPIPRAASHRECRVRGECAPDVGQRRVRDGTAGTRRVGLVDAATVQPSSISPRTLALGTRTSSKNTWFWTFSPEVITSGGSRSRRDTSITSNVIGVALTETPRRSGSAAENTTSARPCRTSIAWVTDPDAHRRQRRRGEASPSIADR